MCIFASENYIKTMRKLFSLFSLLLVASSWASNGVTIPYSQSFDNPASLSDFLTIDGNGDDNCWGYNPMQQYVQCYPSASGPVDDWLILPVELQAKVGYDVAFNCFASLYFERMDVWLGTSPTKEGMTRCLIEPFLFKSEYRTDKVRTSFKVEESGTYYLAFHGCSDYDMMYVYFDNLEINAAPVTAPAAPTDFVATPGAKGNRVCDLSFTLPTLTQDGSPITALNNVNIYRNDNRVATLSVDAEGKAIKPGARCTWHDKELSNRLYTYKVTVVTPEDEEGEAAVQDVYVGIDTPGRLTNLRIREDINEEGTVVITWDVPTVGRHGGYLDPKNLWYRISTNGGEPTVYEPVYREKVDVSQGQTYRAYAVYAENQVGSNRADWQTVSTHVGPAKMAPWTESFPGVTAAGGAWLSHATGTTNVGEARWDIFGGDEMTGAQDGDGGLIGFSAASIGRTARFDSPKIDVRGLAHPVLTFWVNLTGKTDELHVCVMPDMTEWETLSTIVMNEGYGWTRYVIDLSKYKDNRFLQIGLEGVSVESTMFAFAVDNVSVVSLSTLDVAITNYNFPAHLNMGKHGRFMVTVRNQGQAALKKGDYTVDLYRSLTEEGEGELVYSQSGPAVDVDQTADVYLTDTPSIFAQQYCYYYAVANLAGDNVESNNATPHSRTYIFATHYPVPQHVWGTSDEAGVNLTWDAVNVEEGSAESITDTFEEYPSFSTTECGNWTLYDGDKQFTLSMAISVGGVPTLLEYPHVGEPMAWQVFDSYEAGIPYDSWVAHSGMKMMVAMGNAVNQTDGTYHDNDDWLISPQLSGNKQLISFFAKCGMGVAYQPERLQVLVSTTTNSPEAFVPLAGADYELRNVRDWEEFIVEVPQGARYFALRCMSEHKFALLVDDVTYQPAGASELTLRGYNVYRNQQLITPEPIAQPTFRDTQVEEGHRYDYNVTAVYEDSESAASVTASVLHDKSGVAPIMSDVTSAHRLYDLQGRAVAPQGLRRGLYVGGGQKRIMY